MSFAVAITVLGCAAGSIFAIEPALASIRRSQAVLNILAHSEILRPTEDKVVRVRTAMHFEESLFSWVVGKAKKSMFCKPIG